MLDQSSTLFVLFGASGDLARRKLIPALYRLYEHGNLPDDFRLVGYARSALDDAAFRDKVRQSVVEFADAEKNSSKMADFLARFSYLSGGYDNPVDLEKLAETIRVRSPRQLFYYLALPPAASEGLLERFAEDLLPGENARILLEKPFGADLDSARRLNALLAKRFDERSILRIDHYLAKDTVRNLLVFRFANVVFEPLWNRHYIDHIQVSATETLDVEERGGFYDGAGVVRDMLQNHVMMLAALAMLEPPVAGDHESLRDRIGDLLKSVAPPLPGDFLFGQYEGYRDAKNVAPDSITPTFAALRLNVMNWRWDGVPVYLMSGKALDARLSEVTIVFKHIPTCLLDDVACGPADPNVLSLRIHPNEGIRLTLGVKLPGHMDRVAPAALDFRYAELGADGDAAGVDKALSTFDASGHHLFTGYERVLLEALAGRSVMFWRADAVEAAWRIVDPLLQSGNLPSPDAYPTYPRGASGVRLALPLFRKDHAVWYSSDISARAGKRGH